MPDSSPQIGRQHVVAKALEDGREFFLAHHLYKSHRSGEPVARPGGTRGAA